MIFIGWIVVSFGASLFDDMRKRAALYLIAAGLAPWALTNIPDIAVIVFMILDTLLAYFCVRIAVQEWEKQCRLNPPPTPTPSTSPSKSTRSRRTRP